MNQHDLDHMRRTVDDLAREDRRREREWLRRHIQAPDQERRALIGFAWLFAAGFSVLLWLVIIEALKGLAK